MYVLRYKVYIYIYIYIYICIYKIYKVNFKIYDVTDLESKYCPKSQEVKIIRQ